MKIKAKKTTAVDVSILSLIYPTLCRPRQKWTQRPWRPKLSSQKTFSLLFLVFDRMELNSLRKWSENTSTSDFKYTGQLIWCPSVKFLRSFGGCLVTMAACAEVKMKIKAKKTNAVDVSILSLIYH